MPFGQEPIFVLLPLATVTIGKEVADETRQGFPHLV
jgi:hypothetical protein